MIRTETWAYWLPYLYVVFLEFSLRMALLGSCWFIIESILLPDGSLKWFCLSFYIHPFFLCFCRIYLFIRWLHVSLLCIIVFTYRVACFFLSLVFRRLLRRCLVFISSFTIFTSSSATSTDDFLVNEKVEEHKVPEIDHSQIKLFRHDRSKICAFEHQKIIFEVLDDYKVSSVSIIDDHVLDEEPNNEVDPVRVTSSSCTSISNDNLSMNVVSISGSSVDLDMEFPLLCASNSHVTEQELIISRQQTEEEVDLFYKNYADRMRWFDVLSHDRTCGISRYSNLSETCMHFEDVNLILSLCHLK